MSKTHVLKCWPEPFQALWEGTKTAELRKNDRDFAVGDTLEQQEYDPQFRCFSGRWGSHEVTHMVKGGRFGLDGDYVMLSLSRESRRGFGLRSTS